VRKQQQAMRVIKVLSCNIAAFSVGSATAGVVGAPQQLQADINFCR
jgi:hypothetical protein